MGLCVWALLLSPCVSAQEVVPLAVDVGRCECVLPSERPGEKYYLILGSLAREPGPHVVKVRCEATTDPLALPPAREEVAETWRRRVQSWQERQTRARQRPVLAEYPATAPPPKERVFHLFVKDQAFTDAAGYVAVTGELRALGRHCQVYVDRSHSDRAGIQPAVDDVVHTFDADIYPRARRTLGQALDVDRDGRFTVLFTPWLGKLVNGSVSISGFVRGSDFYRDLAAPFGNRCDMMHLNTNLQAGPHLRTIVAHEYTHALIFSEHVFGNYLPEREPIDEECWLNEALAHLAEDEHGHGYSNLDYRVSAFLNDPARYRLVVPDYYAAGLWRSHGHRGATYLFLRWGVDRHGPELLEQLIRSSLNGIENLETATGTPFAQMFRRWTLALALSGSRLGSDVPELRHLDLHRPLAGRLLAGPRLEDVPLHDATRRIQVAGTSAAYVLLHSPAASRSRLIVESEPSCDLQVTLVRLPADTARLNLRHEMIDGRGIRLILTAADADVHLEAAVHERLTPLDNLPEDTSYRSQEAAIRDCRAWFGDPAVKAGASRFSALIPWTKTDGWIFKVTATDQAGHKLGAWCVIEP